MAAASPGTGEYKLVLSSVDPSNFDEAAAQLARLLGIEVTGAQIITESAPIILLEGLTQEQATRAGQNTRALRETGAEVQVLKGRVGKLRRATWPSAAYGQLVARVSTAKELPPAAEEPPPSVPGAPPAPAPAPEPAGTPDASGAGPRQLDDAFAEIESAAQAVMSEMGGLEKTQMMEREEAPHPVSIPPASALPAPPPPPPPPPGVPMQEKGPALGASALPTTFFTCPHCGMTYELRPIDGLQALPGPRPAEAKAAPSPPQAPIPSAEAVPRIMDEMPPVGPAGSATTDSMETDLNLAILDPTAEQRDAEKEPSSSAASSSAANVAGGSEEMSLDVGTDVSADAGADSAEAAERSDAPPQEKAAPPTPSAPVANYLVLVDCQSFNKNARADVAKIVAEVRGIGIVKAEDIIDGSGKHRLVLAKGLEESAARDYEVRLNSICPECAMVSRARFAGV